MKTERTSRNTQANAQIQWGMQLAKQLKVLLRENDVTVAQLARKVGVSSKTIYNWLSGQHPKDIGAVKKVADYFKVSLDYICYDIKSQEPCTPLEHHQDEINAGVFEVVLRRIKK